MAVEYDWGASIMQSYAMSAFGPWWELFLVLAVGPAAIVGIAAMAARWVSSPVWQRTIWQAATLALLGLVIVEGTGTGGGLVRLCRVGLACTASAPDAAASPEPGNAASVEAVAHEEATGYGAAGAHQDVALWNDSDAGGQEGAADCSCASGASFIDQGTDGLIPFAPDDAARSTSPTSDVKLAAWSATPAWWLGVIWGLGAVVILARAARAGAQLSAFRRQCAPVGDAELCGRVGVLARQLGIGRPVRLLAADGLRVPVAFGSLRPTIVLPAAFADEFQWRQQEAMLVHELAHLAARDPLWHLLASLLCALLWWQPLAWWSRRRLRAASEAAADEASLLVPDGPDVLAACLVAVGRRLVQPPRLGWLSVEGNGFRSGLGRRVERLLSLRARSWQAPGRGRLVFLQTLLPVALVIVAISCTAWAQPQVPMSEGETSMNVLSTSWRCSLAATALWALLSPAPASAADEHAPALPKPPVVAEEPKASEPAAPHTERVVLNVAEERKERREGEARGDQRPPRPQGEAREGEGRRPGEGGPSPELAQRRRDLEEKARQLHEKLKSLGDGHEGEARELKANLEKIVRELREMQGPQPGRGPDQQQAMQRLEEINRQIHRAKEAGKGDEVERLEREGRQIKEMLQKGPGRGPDGPGPDQQQAMQRLEEINRQNQRAKEAGKGDEVERLEREGRQIKEMLQKGPGRGPGGQPHPEGMQDMERRLNHLRAAADNLREAGFPEQAENTMRLIERFKGGGPEGMPRGGMMPPPGQPDRVVQELRGEVQQMRREMQELRETLKKLLERDRGGEHRAAPAR